MDENTIKAVIGICPGWTITHIYDSEDIVEFWDDTGKSGVGRHLPDIDFVLQKPKQCGLDALAAAAVRVVEALDGGYVNQRNNFTEVGSRFALRQEHWNDGRTKNTLKAIAEFIKRHPELFDE